MKIKYTLPMFLIDAFTFGLLIASFAIAIYGAITIKEPIPTQYNFQGEISGYGSSMTLFIMPAIMTVSILIVEVLRFILPAEAWNMPFRVVNAKVYVDMAYMLHLMNLCIAAFTFYMTLCIFLQRSMGLFGAMFLVGSLVIISIIWIVKAKRDNI